MDFICILLWSHLLQNNLTLDLEAWIIATGKCRGALSQEPRQAMIFNNQNVFIAVILMKIESIFRHITFICYSFFPWLYLNEEKSGALWQQR